MDPITIIAIVAGLLIAGFLIFIENAFEKILNPILGLIVKVKNHFPFPTQRKVRSLKILAKKGRKNFASNFLGKRSIKATVSPYIWTRLDLPDAS